MAKPWVIKRLFLLGLHSRTSTKCPCGEQALLKNDPECGPLLVATCPTCNKRWGIIK